MLKNMRNGLPVDLKYNQKRTFDLSVVCIMPVCSPYPYRAHFDRLFAQRTVFYAYSATMHAAHETYNGGSLYRYFRVGLHLHVVP